MINYAKVRIGDILRVIGAGMPGYAQNGELVRVVLVEKEAVDVVNSRGEKNGVCFTCGAARLEPTEFENEEDAKKRVESNVA